MARRTRLVRRIRPRRLLPWGRAAARRALLPAVVLAGLGPLAPDTAAFGPVASGAAPAVPPSAGQEVPAAQETPGLPETPGAQEPPAADPRLEGLVRLGDGVVDSGTVVLHRVTPTEAGPVDSTAVGEDGRFTLILPAIPRAEAGDEVYFASTRYEGILYYGGTLTAPEQLDSLYVIEAYPAEAAGPEGERLPVVLRNVILEDEGGRWAVTDIFQIRNDRERTFVPAEEGGAAWRHQLPDGATNFQIGQGELPIDAAVLRNGAVEVTAPVAPGERVYVFRYRLPDLDGGIPVDAPTEALEVLIREPAPDVEVVGLEGAPTAELEPGVNFRRFVGEDVPPGVLAVEPAAGEFRLPMEWTTVLLALVLAMLGIWAVSRRGEGRAAPAAAEGSGGARSSAPAVDTGPEAPRTREGLLREIAALDEAAESPDGPSPEEYRRRREELLARLRAVE